MSRMKKPAVRAAYRRLFYGRSSLLMKDKTVISFENHPKYCSKDIRFCSIKDIYVAPASNSSRDTL